MIADQDKADISSLPGRPEIAGDHTDDDGEVIGNLTKPEANPPAADALPKVEAEALPKPKAMTRILTGSNKVLASWDPTLLMPADPNRESLQIWAASDTDTDYVRFGDDLGKVQSKGGSALLYSGMLLEMPVKHTGPVWISAADATGPVTISFCAVTR